MRSQLLKLSKHSSTKSERQVSELLKRNRVKFRFRARVGRYEVDFLIGRVALEIDGKVHKSISHERDTYLAKKGYVPLHLKVEDIDGSEEEIINLIKLNNYGWRNERN